MNLHVKDTEGRKICSLCTRGQGNGETEEMEKPDVALSRQKEGVLGTCNFE